MSAYDRLDEIQARADKAADGPMCAALLDGVEYDDGTSSHRGGIYPVGKGRAPVFVTNSIDRHDAEFIGHSYADVPALVAALRAVLAVCNTYEATQGIYRIEMGQREIIRVVRAEIEAALKGEDRA